MTPPTVTRRALLGTGAARHIAIGGFAAFAGCVLARCGADR